MTVVHDLEVRLARWLIQRTQTRYSGTGGFSQESFAARRDARAFPQAEVERDHVGDLFALFPQLDLCRFLQGQDVLDFGSGYGGKTTEYKRRCGARLVCGVEPHAHMVAQSRRYAEAEGVDVSFAVCGDREIPYAADSFDVVLSHDVLEHVADPRVSMREIHRVLRRGGISINVFPVYLGAMSHHLDYVTLLPGLHWIFPPQVLVSAVNRILAEDSRFGTAQQPAPRASFDGRRLVLPGLNGLSGRHLGELFTGFDVVSLRRIALGPRGMGLVVNSFLPTAWRDLATATVTCILRKP